jgi:hypothetical protein
MRAPDPTGRGDREVKARAGRTSRAVARGFRRPQTPHWKGLGKNGKKETEQRALAAGCTPSLIRLESHGPLALAWGGFPHPAPAGFPPRAVTFAHPPGPSCPRRCHSGHPRRRRRSLLRATRGGPHPPPDGMPCRTPRHPGRRRDPGPRRRGTAPPLNARAGRGRWPHGLPHPAVPRLLTPSAAGDPGHSAGSSPGPHGCERYQDSGRLALPPGPARRSVLLAGSAGGGRPSPALSPPPG